MDFLLGSLTAGTGGDGMNLGTIENMEVRKNKDLIGTAQIKQLYSISLFENYDLITIFPNLGIGIDGMSCVSRPYYSSNQAVRKGTFSLH